MPVIAYYIAYAFANLFGTYTLYRFNGIFFDKQNTKKRTELIAYGIVFILSMFKMVLVRNSVVSMLADFLVVLGASFIYTSVTKKRIYISLFMFSVLKAIQLLVEFLYYISDIREIVITEQEGLMICMLIEKTVAYGFVTVLKKFKGIKKSDEAPNVYWFSIFLIPLASVFFLYIMSAKNIVRYTWQKTLGTVLLFVINFVSFFLFDTIISSYSEKIEQQAMKQQGESYKKQLEIVQANHGNIRSIRHDIKNHICTIRTYAEQNENDKIIDYLDSLMSYLKAEKIYANTANIEIDGLVNMKLSKAERENIVSETSFKIPERLSVEPLDISIVFGNLLDNAIEAAEKCEGEKRIMLDVRYDKNILFITLKNTYNGELLQKGDTLLSTKKDDEEIHGIGINNIRKTLEKYDGLLEYSYDSEYFTASVMMYV